MKIVHSWLNELVEVPDDHDAVAAVMTELGLAVEEVLTVGRTVPGVITARVLRTENHPDTKVHRVFVDAGDGVERHIWCGAFNMAAGDVVPLATPGTVMPDGRDIQPKPIAGIMSQGMLCSARELGLGDDHAGILLLPADAPLGVPYGEVLGLTTETVYDIDLTRNRPDCWGHLGVARDIAPRFGAVVGPRPRIEPPAAPGRQVTIELADPSRCPLFHCTVISGVRVGPSPDWLAGRLAAAGMRPINNVVDASNAVLLELNQPNHAYDLDQLGGGGFRVRRARDGEVLRTLDGNDRALHGADLLICDATDVPVGLAGIMGGADSEITEATTTIALEIAWFNPADIMRSATRLGLRSEASLRFERGVDPDGMGAAAARFVELLRLTAPDAVVESVQLAAQDAPTPVSLDVRVVAVNRLLGTSLDADGIAALIGPIGFATEYAAAAEVLRVNVPTWRPDCVDEVDIIEEVARHYGYARIGKRVPSSTMHGRLSVRQSRRRQLRQVLLGLGFSEAMPNPFLSPDDLTSAGLDGPVVTIVNPLAVEESVLRTSLRPGLLRAIAYNESHRRDGVALFEIGHVYPPSDDQLPAEYEALGVVLAGSTAAEAVAVWRELTSAMGFGARIDQGSVPPGMHPTRSATLTAGRSRVGVVGEVHPDVLDAFGVHERVAVLELDLDLLLADEPKPTTWRPTSRFPSSDLDLAFVVPDSVPAEKVEKAIKQGAGNVLAALDLFDVYRGPGVDAGARSLAYRLRLQAADHTLTEAEIGQLRERIVVATTKLGATLRGG